MSSVTIASPVEGLFHPLANIFPLIDGAAFDELVADIKAHGVREPIWLYEDQIIDGRNRYRATEVADVDCPTRTYKGNDPLAFVISLNLKRRHLNASQLAFVALDIERIEAEQAKERMSDQIADRLSMRAQIIQYFWYQSNGRAQMV